MVLLEALNGPWHRRALQGFLILALAHVAEHVLQAYQVYGLGWPRAQALGALGMWFPWLVTSEWLHYGYVFLTLVGLALLRPAFGGAARRWWGIALVIQVWHHVEHALLLGQAMVGKNLFGSPVPTSLVQLIVPRVELHLFYNAVVLAPILMATYYHLYPSAGQARASSCTCSCLPQDVAAIAP